MNLFKLFLTDGIGEVTEAVAEVTEAVASNGFGAEMQSTLTFAERISLGLQVAGLGLGVVFSILAILWGVLTLFRVVFYDIPNRKKSAPKAATPEPQVTEAPAAVAEIEAVAVEADEAELIAAITAAVSIVMDKPQTSFRVVSFRRTASK